MRDRLDRGGSPLQGVDPEVIASLIDGRLSDTERQALLAKLGASEQDLDVLMDAAAAVADLRRSGLAAKRPAADSVGSPRRLIWRRFAYGGALAAAAAIALMVGRSPLGRRSDSVAAHEMIAALSDKSPPPSDWNYSPWDARRGAGEVADTTAYFRIGFRLTDLELALQNDRSSSTAISQEIAELLLNVPGGAALANVFNTFAKSGEVNGDNRARERLSELPRQDLIVLGSWVEAARLAAARKDTRWFNRDENQHMLTTLNELKAISPANRPTAGDTDMSISDWSRLQRFLEDVAKAF